MVFTLSGVAFAQQMSDDQVVQYVKSAQQMGKNQKQITTELMRRGVTRNKLKEFRKSMNILNLEVRRAIPKMRNVLVNVVK